MASILHILPAAYDKLTSFTDFVSVKIFRFIALVEALICFPLSKHLCL